ncbi:hypothetical protein U1Q18_047990 [Sarracenia purpurea var. burkii]
MECEDVELDGVLECRGGNLEVRARVDDVTRDNNGKSVVHTGSIDEDIHLIRRLGFHHRRAVRGRFGSLSLEHGGRLEHEGPAIDCIEGPIEQGVPCIEPSRQWVGHEGTRGNYKSIGVLHGEHFPQFPRSYASVIAFGKVGGNREGGLVRHGVGIRDQGNLAKDDDHNIPDQINGGTCGVKRGPTEKPI